MCISLKRFFKIFVAAMVVVTVAAAVLCVYAQESARRVDPSTLQPTSDRVIFIKDAPAGGTLSGDGSGFDADNPYIPSEHEQFDPTADYPQNHLKTAFYQATEMLGDDGGTIVICGPVHLGLNESYGSGDSTKDVFTYKWGTKTVIKFTSVYNGVDYRETAGAKITLATPAEIGVMGSSIWENITIVTDGTDRVMSFASCPTLIGEGFETYPKDEAYKEVAANYLSVSGGHRYARGDDQIPTLTIKSGTFNKVVAGLWGVTTNKEMTNATTYLTLEGSTTVLGSVIGTIGKNTNFSGHVNITINGGKYNCDIFGVGKTGMTNDDGSVDLVINGGDFSEAWSICSTAPGMTNKAPSVSILDLSGYTGEKVGLAQAFGVAADFSLVKLPEGVTADQLVELVNKETEPETEAVTVPETEKQTEKTEDKEEPKETEKVEEPENNTQNNDTQNNTSASGDSNLMLILIIVIVVAVVVIAGFGTVIVVLLKKKK